MEYETADFCQVSKGYGSIDYVCKLDAIPVENGRYDVVLCTQVLEHVAEPWEVFLELNRVLKPRGRLLLTAPLCWDEHEKPYDFYRYTQFGLSHLATRAGFEVQSLEWLEGFCGSFAFHLGRAAHSLPLRPSAYGGGLLGLGAVAVSACLRPMLSVLSRWYAMLDLRHQYTGKGYCLNYGLQALKIKDVGRRQPLAA